MVTDAEQLYSNIVTFFSCEDVRGIISGGRGSKNVLHAIKFLRLKPIIQLDNKNQYAGIATNYKNAMKKIIAKIRSDYEGVELNAENIIRISIYYSGYEQEKRSYIINALVEAFNFPIEKITVRWLPATVLIHTRFGSYGVSVETNISHKQKQYK
jgi:fatty acid-binding protein DegV